MKKNILILFIILIVAITLFLFAYFRKSSFSNFPSKINITDKEKISLEIPEKGKVSVETEENLPKVREFKVKFGKERMIPEEIEVNKGEIVRIIIEDEDCLFSIPERHIKFRVLGRGDVQFKAEESEGYTFICQRDSSFSIGRLIIKQ